MGLWGSGCLIPVGATAVVLFKQELSNMKSWNKSMLCSTGNYTQCLAVTCDENKSMCVQV